MRSVPVSAEALAIPCLQASSYSEAAGLVLALREGLDPQALIRQASSAR